MDQHLAAGKQPRRRTRLVSVLATLFVVVMALALLHGAASAEEDTGTIPPGGTVPPAPIDFIHGFVRVVHAAPFAADVNDTAVDICDENDNPISGLTGLLYLTESGYLPFAPGSYDWYVGAPGCASQVVDIPPFNLFVNAALTLYIVGDGANQPLTTVLSVDRAGLDLVMHLPLIHLQVEDAEDDPKQG
jgi:hypothetical protein